MSFIVASSKYGNSEYERKYSFSFISIHNPCGVIFSTLAAKMLEPFFNDFIFMPRNQLKEFIDNPFIKPLSVRQCHNWLNPKFSLAVLTFYVNMDPPFFV
jgi:hypothetical protein